MHYHAMSVVAPNSRSNMTHETCPEYSFANQMAGLLKHGTAISHSHLFPGGSGSTPRRPFETRDGLNCMRTLYLRLSHNRDRSRISLHPQAQKLAAVLPDDQLNRAVKNRVPFNLSIWQNQPIQTTIRNSGINDRTPAPGFRRCRTGKWTEPYKDTRHSIRSLGRVRSRSPGIAAS